MPAKNLIAALTLFTCLASAAAQAAPTAGLLELPAVFSDHMVLQRGKPVTVFGVAAANADVRVEFATHREATKAGTDGAWSVTLPAMPASSVGRDLRVRAELGAETKEVTIRDVVFGDVWLCAGQSNMRWRVRQSAEAAEMLEMADLPNLRLLDFEGRLYPSDKRYDLELLRGLTPENYYSTAGWQRSTAESAATFSAVAFAFGHRLLRDLDVPIGLIHNAIGGAPIESYLAPDDDKVDANVRQVMASWLEDPRYPAWCLGRANRNLEAWLEDPTGKRPHHPFEPSFLFDAGIRPLRRFPLTGCIWYQGESNATATAGSPPLDPALNKAALTSLIGCFRRNWNDPKLPFYFVQLPGIERQWALFREMQLEVEQEVQRTGMAITIDLGDPVDVHPRRKKPVGERLARLALARSYDRDIVPTGPLYRELVREGSRVRIHFGHAIGLRTADGDVVRGFEVAAEDREFRPAQASIDGQTVLVHAADVRRPTAVRYAFENDPDGNLQNGELLPASPFRSDRWDNTAPAQQEFRGCSFEATAVGELREATLPIGILVAEPGHAEITDRFARTGRQCLHLMGGEDRELVLTPAAGGAPMLSFWAERWTRRGPFEFRVEALQAGQWREVYNGDETVRVGRGFLTHVQIPLGPRATRLRFRSTSPRNSGVLIDDLELQPLRPMQLLGIAHANWVAPALHRRAFNPITKVAITTTGTAKPPLITECKVTIPDGTRLADIANVSVFYTQGGNRGAGRRFGDPQKPARFMTFRGQQLLAPGISHLWISVQLREGAPLHGHVAARCSEVGLAKGIVVRAADDVIVQPIGDCSSQRIGIAIRTADEDGCHTTRIPGLATTNKGTLIAVYDNRYRGSGDLPGDIDVAMSRSTDGGNTWQPMRVIMDMGDDPEWEFDGIGDPAVLVDRRTDRIWVAATWSHGPRSWNGSGPGLEPAETGQFMLAHSDDDGLTWSKPINITRQVKDPAWRFVLAGPGAGITLRDGTLVFAAQYRSADDSPFAGKPFSTLIHSKDRGETWTIGTGVKVDTTEAQLVELADGTIMINCRDNRVGSRSVYTTADLGATWRVHPTSRSALPEPRCMASLIRFEDAHYGPLLVFSNPATRSGRRNMTLKVSRDDGMSWPLKWHTLYDQRTGFGYSCLTQIDGDHVGVLYEGNRELYFLRLPIRELVERR